MSEERYRVLRVLPGMDVGSEWCVAGREKHLDGHVILQSVNSEQCYSIPGRYLVTDWFEWLWDDDNDLFHNCFGEWILKHGCKPTGPYAQYQINLNELKSAIMNLDLS